MEQKSKNALTRWLENLQQESWQLELLISGFAIFLLIGAYEPLIRLGRQIDYLASAIFASPFEFLYIPYYILLTSWYIVVINLILHVLVRGLWISTIGLRYISGDIDLPFLRLHPKFEQFLKKRMPGFDDYIQQLEKLCSIIFAFTFLIVFLLLSVGLIGGTLFFMRRILHQINPYPEPDWADLFTILFLIPASFYLLDFITLGWLKRQKYLVGFYYPIYRFFNILSLAFLYRPLYYNMIDNRYSRRVVLFLIPYSVGLALALSMKVQLYEFLPENRNAQSINNTVYDDTREKDDQSFVASIPSKFVENGFIPLFLPYYPRYDDQVISILCPELKKAKTGIFFLGQKDPARTAMDAQKALDCSAERFQIYVNDSLQTHLKFRFYDHPTQERIGLLTVLDVDYLPRGEHAIRIMVRLPEYREGGASLYFVEGGYIPFWKE